MAAKTFDVRGRTPRKQMYLIEFEGEVAAQNRSIMRGRVFAWNWAPTLGWTEASRDPDFREKLKPVFGEQGVDSIAQNVLAQLRGAPAHRLRWNELVKLVPEVRFMVPTDLDIVVESLKNGGVLVDYDFCQIPSIFELRAYMRQPSLFESFNARSL